MIQNDITTLLGLASFIWAICQYFDSHKREQNLKEFENYHKLIKELVQPDDEKIQCTLIGRLLLFMNLDILNGISYFL